MEKEEIFEKVKEKLAGMGIGDIHPDSRLEDDLGLDSLDKYDFLFQTEEEFGIRFSIDEVSSRSITTVQDVCDMVAEQLQKK